MKFVSRHRSDILSALSRHGFQESDVSFIKRRGRICIIHEASGQGFNYLRKKETRLDPTDHQWVHREWFKVKAGDHKEIDIDIWSAVITAFDHWLKNLAE